MSGGRTPQGRGGAPAGGGEGESEEGGVRAFHTGNHTGQQPPGLPYGEGTGSHLACNSTLMLELLLDSFLN